MGDRCNRSENKIYNRLKLSKFTCIFFFEFRKLKKKHLKNDGNSLGVDMFVRLIISFMLFRQNKRAYIGIKYKNNVVIT